MLLNAYDLLLQDLLKNIEFNFGLGLGFFSQAPKKQFFQVLSICFQNYQEYSIPKWSF